MRLWLADAADGARHVCPGIPHPAIGTDLVGGDQVLAGGVPGAGPYPRRSLIGGDADGNGGVGTVIEHSPDMPSGFIILTSYPSND